MAKGPSLLSSTAPTGLAAAQVHIGHVQLRDLIICPQERGIVNYVTKRSIVEHDLNVPGSAPRTLVDVGFTPNTLSSLQLDGKGHTLLAAGGQEAELHLSLYNSSRRRTAPSWRFEDRLHASINNSVMLTSLNVTKSNESSFEPRVAISNNDCTVKFFDVPISLRGQAVHKIKDVGTVKLNVPVNHSSISPDGLTLLSVGDSSKVFLHRISGGSRLTFSPISTLTVPPPDHSPLSLSSTSLAASFSTAFSPDGTKYAVGSQEGVVAVWDVRSSKPLKVFQTDKTRFPSGSSNWGVTGTGLASGWLSDDPYEWTRGNSKAPGWSVRNVKFGSGGGNGCGKEIITFTEHTSLLHVVDARTFETEEIVHVPSARTSEAVVPSSSTTTRSSSRRILPSRTQSSQRLRSFASRPYQRPTTSTRPSSRHVAVSATSHLSRRDSGQPPAPPYVVLALEDTFRISARGNGGVVSTSSSTVPSNARALRSNLSSDFGASGLAEDVFGAFTTPGAGDDDSSDLLVIPPLGDPEVEDDVRTLLGRHGIPARRVSMRDDDDEYEPGQGYDRMEIDELGMDMDQMETEPIPEPEWDCLSSHAPSRTSSPPPGAVPGNRWRMWPSVEPIEREPEDEGMESEDDDDETLGRTSGSRYAVEPAFTEDLDIAGTCFDPTGAYIYVGTTESVAEWNVKGAEKRWWLDEGNEWC